MFCTSLIPSIAVAHPDGHVFVTNRSTAPVLSGQQVQSPGALARPGDGFDLDSMLWFPCRARPPVGAIFAMLILREWSAGPALRAWSDG